MAWCSEKDLSCCVNTEVVARGSPGQSNEPERVPSQTTMGLIRMNSSPKPFNQIAQGMPRVSDHFLLPAGQLLLHPCVCLHAAMLRDDDSGQTSELSATTANVFPL